LFIRRSERISASIRTNDFWQSKDFKTTILDLSMLMEAIYGLGITTSLLTENGVAMGIQTGRDVTEVKSTTSC
jgi:hypothetical protein